MATSIIDRIRACPLQASEVIDQAKKGVLVLTDRTLSVADRTPRTLSSLSSTTPAIEKLIKVLIAVVKIVAIRQGDLIFYQPCLKSLEQLKNFYYAFNWIDSVKDFSKIKTEMRDGKEVIIKDGKGNPIYEFCWPDLTKGLYAVANGFELCKFLHTHKVLSFQRCTEIGMKLGSYQVWGLSYTVNKLPFLGTFVFDTLIFRPKDLFIFFASINEVCIGVHTGIYGDKDGKRDWIAIGCKVTSAAGKIFLITLGKAYGATYAFAILDLVTQSASLCGFLYKSSDSSKTKLSSENPPNLPLSTGPGDPSIEGKDKPVKGPSDNHKDSSSADKVSINETPPDNGTGVGI